MVEHQEDDSRSEASRMRALRVNSIRSDRFHRILQPCEARAGHGVIALIISLAVVTLVLMVVVRLLYRAYLWLTG